jgi:hypothetical protein
VMCSCRPEIGYECTPCQFQMWAHTRLFPDRGGDVFDQALAELRDFGLWERELRGVS